jgi:hypothetical protein
MPGRFKITLIWLLWAVFGGGCDSQRSTPTEVPQANVRPADDVNAQQSQPSPVAEVTPSTDLTKVRGFTTRVVAVTGETIADETEPIDGISDWSFNKRGQLTVLAGKNSDSGFLEWDLYLIDGGRADCLMRQRAKAPLGDRVVRHFFGCELNDRGSALLHVAQNAPPGWRLVLIDRQNIQPLPLVRPLSEDPYGTESIAGSQGHVAFVERKPVGSVRPSLFLSDGTHTEVLASAQNDPFDPRRRFRGFGRLHGVNARGQVLFEASVQQDEVGVTENERLCLYTPALSNEGKLVPDDESPRGEIRELARQGAVLPGTDWTVPRDTDCWNGVTLSDRGDVMFSGLTFSGLPVATGGVFVLRPDSDKWQEILRTVEVRNQPTQFIQYISYPAINARGQIACATNLVNGKTYETVHQLLRIEPDATRKVLAGTGDELGPGLTIDNLSAVQVLTDGKVVFMAGLRPAEFSEPREAALVVADQAQQRLIIRESDLPVSGSQRVQIDHFRTSDTLHVAVLAKRDVIDEMLVLVTPDISLPQARPE